jgi:PAS domain-containing protein
MNKNRKSTRKKDTETEVLPGISKGDTRSFRKSLKQLQELQSSALSAIPHAVVGLKDRTIFFANEAVETVFGWKSDEIIGQKTELFYRNGKDHSDITPPSPSLNLR